MTKHEFMQRLAGSLAPLPAEERKDILADFEEHFANGLAGGKTEQEVAAELGDPAALAAQYTEGLPPAPQPVKASGVAQAVLAALGLLLFDLIIAFPVIATLFAVWISMWSVVAALLCCAGACLLSPFFGWVLLPSALTGVGMFILGIAGLALTVLSAIAMAYVTKWFYLGLAAYVKAHIRIIGGSTK
jgi:uncharacterized membrane protein